MTSIAAEAVVSVKVSPKLERLKERNIDDEEISIQRKLIDDFIKSSTNTNSPSNVPKSNHTIYLMRMLSKCFRCQGKLELTRNKKGKAHGRTGVCIYTKSGPRFAEVWSKHYSLCACKIYYCYLEYTEDDQLIREYHKSGEKLEDLFSITQDTYFSNELFEDLSEDIYTSDVRFVRWVEKYNRIYPSNMPLIKNRVFAAWIMWSVNKLVHLKFIIKRKADRNLDLGK